MQWQLRRRLSLDSQQFEAPQTAVQTKDSHLQSSFSEHTRETIYSALPSTSLSPT